MSKPEQTTVKVAPSSRRNRDQLVVDAAIEVMSKRGYPATPIQEIADRVGVLKGSLYHYFSSKEELLFRILQEAHVESDRINKECSELDLSPFDELLEYMRRESLWLLQNVDRANIYFTESRHLTGDRRKEFAKLAAGFKSHISSMIQNAINDGDIRSDLDAQILAEFVITSLNSVRAWPAGLGSTHTPEESAESFTLLIRDALRGASVTS